ncbi:MAG TPA: condensation domain-containing protein, partial [Longimicrobium sp.]|nr:condensation domain-containing protein [Longimicrobium sp.]
MTDLDDRLATLSPAKRALLEKLRLARQPSADQPIPRIPDGPAPLSAEQRRLWYVLQLAAGYPVYTVPIGLRLRGDVDTGAMADALRDLVARHEALRTAFRESAGVPVQQVGDGSAFAPEIVDLRGDEWAEEEATYQGDAFARRTFDYGRGEPFRARLLRLADDDVRLLLAFHHLAGDGWSAGVMLRDLGELYAARLAGRAPSLPELPIRFRDWAAWQQRPDAPPPAEDEAYWRDQLAGAPRVLELPTDHPRPPLQSWEGAKHPFDLSADLTERLRALARREHATLYAVVAAAFALLLRRYTGEDDVLVGTMLANRPRPELEQLVGFFANTLPLRVRLDGDPSVAELVRRAHAAAVGAQEHASLPFDRIVEIADVPRDFSRPPLVQAVLTFADSPANSLAIDGVEVEPLLLDPSVAIFDLTLSIEDRGATISCLFQYASRLFDGGTVRRMADHLLALLRAFADDAARPVSRIRLAGDEETRVVAKWSRAEEAESPALLVHQRVEAQARETP